MLSTISSWILSIAGVVCLSTIVELILPSGQMNRYIKAIFSFIIIFVIIMPIPKLLKMNINLDKNFIEQEIPVQEDYLYQLNLNKLMKIKEETEEELQVKGYKNVIVSLNADIFVEKIEIKSINVDITRLVISDKLSHTSIVDVRRDIAKIVQNHVDIEEGKIFFDE